MYKITRGIFSLLVSVMLVLSLASSAMADEGHYIQTAEITATINNPNPADRLNLRTKPSEDAPTLGKYYNGTYVEVLSEEKDGWVKVRFCNLEGYMMAKFLAYHQAQSQVGASAIPAVKIKNAGGTGLNLRKTQSTSSASLGLYKNGETVLVYGVSETWCHVQAPDGKIGFMLRKQLSPVLEYQQNSSSSGGGSQPNKNFIVVNNPDKADRLNLRTKPSEDAPTLGKYYNGTFVEALSKEKNGWIKVRIFSLEGYMMAKFLVTPDQIPMGAATVPTCTIDSVDGTGVTLHKTQSTVKNTSLGLYPYGQTVRVFGVSETWCHVQTEDGKTGFMPRKSLSPVLEFDKGQSIPQK